MRTPGLLSLCALLVFLPAMVRADEPDEPAPAADSAGPPSSTSSPGSTVSPAEPNAGADLNFDLFSEKKETPAQKAAERARVAKLEHEAHIRRQMLLTHQGFGFATLGLLAATMVLGQLNFQDKFGGGDYTGKYNTPHLVLSAATTAAFATTGLLGAFAPNPYPKPIKLDTALIHKIAMIVASAGMLAEIILGPISVSQAGQLDQRNLAIAHLAIGWSTFAVMTGGVIVYVF